jgi:flavin reductase (DIM6/NTAB) family NADH-FMN oxidoreductase RutF
MNKIDLPPERCVRMPSPSVLAIVTARDGARHDITPVGWSTNVSSEPPMFAFSIATTAFCNELIQASGEFAINYANQDLIDQITYCGKVSGRITDKWAKTGLAKLPARKIAAPLIGECIAHLECKLVTTYRPGSMDVIVGQVIAAQAAEGAFDEWWTFAEPDLTPIHHIGNYRYAYLGNAKQATDRFGA